MEMEATEQVVWAFVGISGLIILSLLVVSTILALRVWPILRRYHRHWNSNKVQQQRHTRP